MPPTRAQLINTAHAFIAAYNKWTIPDVLSIRSPSCKHYTLPGTQPARNNQEFGEFLEGVMPVIRNFRLHLADTTAPLVVDVEARQVVMHLRSTAETDVGPYGNEYLFVLRVSEDGGLVDEVVEFLDSAYTAGFVARLREKGLALG